MTILTLESPRPHHDCELLDSCPDWCTMSLEHHLASPGLHVRQLNADQHADVCVDVVANTNVQDATPFLEVTVFGDLAERRREPLPTDPEHLRGMAASLLEAADNLERVAGVRVGRGPDQADVDALRGLLDLVENFSSSDQRARYLLSSDWLRGRLGGAVPGPSKGAVSRMEHREVESSMLPKGCRRMTLEYPDGRVVVVTPGSVR